MSTIKCPYCQTVLSTSKDLETIYISDGFSSKNDNTFILNGKPYYEISEYTCSECKNKTITIKGVGKQYKDIDTMILPVSDFKQFPNYIPQAILNDYQEAYQIRKISPKASATLSRRCLQGMIHDFWGIKEKNLNCEISALKDKVTIAEWKVIDALRQIGNIGAHMEADINLIVDIDEGEAEKLLKLIELLIEKWYINRHDTEKLFSDIININVEKQNKRKP